MTTKHPLATTAGLRRALKPGTVVGITNHIRPEASRLTTVHAKTTTRALATYGSDRNGKVVDSWTNWPKAAALDPDPEFGNIVTIRTENGSAFLTLVVYSSAKLADVPAEYRADGQAAA